jgi:hypothetical protein
MKKSFKIVSDSNAKYINQHLYIISDDDIKIGDYIYSKLNGEIILCDKECFETLTGCSYSTKYGYKKIIDTTNSIIKDKIHKFHKMYTRDEVIELINKYYYSGKFLNRDEAVEWIKENL